MFETTHKNSFVSLLEFLNQPHLDLETQGVALKYLNSQCNVLVYASYFPIFENLQCLIIDLSDSIIPE